MASLAQVIAKLPPRFRAIADEVTWELAQGKVVPGIASKDGWVDMGNQPRVCGLCGGPIVLGGKNLRSTWFKTCPPVATWHMNGCPEREAA